MTETKHSKQGHKGKNVGSQLNIEKKPSAQVLAQGAYHF